MGIRNLMVLAASLVVAGNALAKDGEALASTSNCMMCHDVAKKSTGPAFRDVAAKYRDDKNALVKLEKKIRSGGAGTWGNMPMPPTARAVTDEDIKHIVQWILALK